MNGAFYNLETGFFASVPSPGKFSALRTNSMFTFNEKPTIFGTCFDCQPDEEEDLVALDVIQYQAEKGSWEVIGQMQQDRQLHEVVEVPASFCDDF